MQYLRLGEIILLSFSFDNIIRYCVLFLPG